MCGIAGYLAPGEKTAHFDETLSAMADALRHRGPDDGGLWYDAEKGVGLAHRRLAILDLSGAGHQPMHAASGRYVLAFNGEIYNFRELQRELAELGHCFRGHSDTEVMLAAFDAWGVAAALSRFTGMFAFALWDRQRDMLYLARDRAGEKPLYYGWCGGSFLFSSELKALRRHPDWHGGVDPFSLHLLLRYTYLPAPHCIHPGVYKLPAGSLLTLSRGGASGSERIIPYWSLLETLHRAEPFTGNDPEALQVLDAALSRAVKRQMVADVPLGAFLSGGIDSSTVVALMQAQSAQPVKTFTIGFHEKGYDEAAQARAVARHLGTEHTELYVTDREALEVIPQLPRLYDEPFADSSQIPTFLLARLARSQVTVSLSGDGGDELFGGYRRYALIERHWRRISCLPAALRRAALRGVEPALSLVEGALGRLPGKRPDLARLRRLARLAAAGSVPELNELLTCYDRWAGEATGYTALPVLPKANRELWEAHPKVLEHLMLLDFQRYLPDDILVKVDRAAMAVSLETRIPLLDPEVIELSWRLPRHFKWRDGEGKWLLRQVLYQYLPRHLVDRPKSGFGIPVGHWLKGPLREWGESLLSEAALQHSGLLVPGPIRRTWQEHVTGAQDRTFELWPVLMFQAWLLEGSSGNGG
ncbi:asparagine synthetase B [Geomonas silvestris]|uniref:asparagine synthase (glutamine-hydrolyzing) n=1 Tax=Geomonas silvestris TaxID=2740184 RepID=A0A6V8MH78_9BACT|nr:asparagine synthase (glutamine-hydrolyzing) [Geomonas silvestris]GFO59340.1 asparagine synthetase B [Geomonas silvestris]